MPVFTVSVCWSMCVCAGNEWNQGGHGDKGKQGRRGTNWTYGVLLSVQ